MAVTAPEMITVIAPPSPTDGRYETLFDGYARVALYGYNDILIRRETEGLDIDEGDINGRYAAYLSIDGWTPLGSGPGSPPPRVIVYGASPHYHLLKLATSAKPPAPPLAPDAAMLEHAPLDIASAAAYRVEEGEALRRVRLLRERPEGARDVATREAPSRYVDYYEDPLAA